MCSFSEINESSQHDYIYRYAPFAQMKSSRKHVPMTCIPVVHISYQVFPKQDVCSSKSLQVTQKVPKWSETEVPKDGFIIINVDTDLC